MYGASLGNQLLLADRPDIYHQKVITEIKKLSPDDLSKLFVSAKNVTDGSHLLMATGPLPNSRREPERKITSPYVLTEICSEVLKNRVEMMRGFYDTLHVTPTTSVAAGMVFEHRAHHFLQEERTLDLFPILASSQPQGRIHFKYVYEEYIHDVTRRQQVFLPRLEERIVDKETQHTHEFGVYYRPRRTNFPAVDSWVIVPPNDPKDPPIVLVFQMTINMKEHDAKKSGLDWMRELIPKDAEIYHVILTPQVVEPKINVSTDYLTAGFLGDRNVNDAFRVRHCMIHSVDLFKPNPF